MLDRYRTPNGEIGDVGALCEAAGALLDAASPESPDARVSARPDVRTLRYYQTLGVLDRPLRYDGRQAIYGFRHLLQAVAVKLLQARGFTLSQAQQALAGATDAALEQAVQDALGQGVPVPMAAAPPPAPVSLIAAEIAPGVTILVDPRKIADPDSLLRTLSQSLSQLPPTPPGGKS